MLRLWGVWNGPSESWEQVPSTATDEETSRIFAGVMGQSYEAKSRGDFLQVTPEVREAVKAIRTKFVGTTDQDELAILNWALAGIPEENGDAPA